MFWNKRYCMYFTNTKCNWWWCWWIRYYGWMRPGPAWPSNTDGISMENTPFQITEAVSEFCRSIRADQQPELRKIGKELRADEEALKFIRDGLRKNPEDERFRQLIQPAEEHYRLLKRERDELLEEKAARIQGRLFRFCCTFCGRKNESYARPAACGHCGQDAPADLERTTGKAAGES